MPTWEEDIVYALRNLGGSSSYDQLYEEVARARQNGPKTWKDIVRRRIQDLSSDSQGFKGGADMFFSVEGLGNGFWGLREKVVDTPTAIHISSGEDGPIRVLSQQYRILRDTALARKIKLIHRDTCQLCGLVVRIQAGKTYAEAHHIIPLGRPHNGPDTPENIIVLCPYHHVLCDYGATKLDLNSISFMSGHIISQRSIDYHNEKIFGATHEDFSSR